MPISIKVENLSKAYQLGEIGTGTLSNDLKRFFARVQGKEDPFLQVGEVNDRTKKGRNDTVWSLKDINFKIAQGDTVGIIGRNGAGKSTLLKLLSRVTAPTTGSVKIKGRIASLLEVGTGFHPDLSGRDNIYLNGAILGMRKAEIARKFDEIVDFSGVERYIDTPVKRYSSGMYVRLAFAVAAHLESEILIVDEVLAVGDAEFQKKCLGKMGDISKGEGRTILFVSHNMGAIEVLCNHTILMNNGNIVKIGPTEEVVNDYLYLNNLEIGDCVNDLFLTSELKISIKVDSNVIDIGQDLIFDLKVNNTIGFDLSDLSVLIYSERDLRISVIDLRHVLNTINPIATGCYIRGKIAGINFIPGTYKIKLYIKSHTYDGNTDDLIQFHIKDPTVNNIVPYSSLVTGLVKLDHQILNFKFS